MIVRLPTVAKRLRMVATIKAEVESSPEVGSERAS